MQLSIPLRYHYFSMESLSTHIDVSVPSLHQFKFHHGRTQDNPVRTQQTLDASVVALASVGTSGPSTIFFWATSEAADSQ
jgi:hypothetical protein